MANNAKSELLQLYQKLKLAPPKFTTAQNPDAHFVCELTCERVERAGHVLDSCAFLGQARQKKAAEQNAAAKALERLRDHPVFATSHADAPQTVAELLLSLSTIQVLKKDLILEGSILNAAHHHNTLVPMAAVLRSKAVTTWLKAALQTTTPPDLDVAAEKLLSAIGEDTAAHAVVVREGHGAWFKLPHPHAADRAPVPATAELEQLTVVLIPASLSVPPQELQLSHGSSHLDAIGKLLGSNSAAEVIDWGVAGTRVHHLLHPDDAVLKAEAARPDTTTTASTAAGTDPAALTHSPTQPSVYSLYHGQPDSRPINLRAAWLLGQPVRGPVLLSTTRLSASKETRFVINWRSFPLPSYFTFASAMFPAYNYSHRTAPLLAQLPLVYRSASSWAGPTPTHLLNSYCSRNSWRCSAPQYTITSVQSGREGRPPGPTVSPCACTVTIQGVFGSQHVVVTGDTATNEATATERAALAAIHVLHDQDAAALQPGAQAAGPSSVQQRRGEEVHKMEVVDAGDAFLRPAQPGLIAKVECAVAVLTRSGEEVAVESRPSLMFVVGGGGAVPAVDAAVRALHTGGVARCRTDVCLQGPDPLGTAPRHPAVISVKLVQLSTAANEGVEGGSTPLFSPPLSQLRYQFIADIVQQQAATAVVDIGCGDGKLMAHLLKSHAAGSLKRVVGVEISADGINRGHKRLRKLVEAAGGGAGGLEEEEGAGAERVEDVEEGLGGSSGLGGQAAGEGVGCREVDQAVVGMEREGGDGRVGEAPAGSSVPDCEGREVAILRGSAFQAGLEEGRGWGALRGCDLAALIEVVEHLDPQPLGQLGPCILGGLRPKVLVVTTPNWEYNAVMRAQGGPEGWPGPPGRDGLPLRCSDHRFEWTREEMEGWASQLAAAYGYSVRFDGIGKVQRESEVLAGPAWLGPSDPGHASQAAVFTLLEAPQEAGTSGEAAQGQAAPAGSAGAVVEAGPPWLRGVQLPVAFEPVVVPRGSADAGPKWTRGAGPPARCASVVMEGTPQRLVGPLMIGGGQMGPSRRWPGGFCLRQRHGLRSLP